LGNVKHYLLIEESTMMKKISAYEKFLRENDLRRKEARKLRKQGLTWAEIGLHLGVTRQRAQQMGSKK